LCGCATALEDTVFQTSTIDALLAGVYDGNMTCQELLQKGDFGIGTFDSLDGEMIVTDGCVYQVKADGNVYTPQRSFTTPFATVCKFKTDQTFLVLAETNYDAIKKMLDGALPNQNLFYAIRMTGEFKDVKTRSVPAQTKPYPPLFEVTKNQPEFEMQNISGTIIGFRCPAYVEGINVPGYHLHFLSKDRNRGGHLLSFTLSEGSCEVDVLHNFFLTLPENAPAFAETDLSKDRTNELYDIENKGR